jgi:polyisoprenoid-binding protein YceI
LGNWQLDPYHTQVEFSAKHLGMMTVRGHFAEVSSTATIDADRPELASLEVVVQTASIRTNHQIRDNDLRSASFLDVDQHPTMTFRSTGVEPAGPDRWAMAGELTIKGNTRPVTLQVLKYGELNDPGMMGHRIAYSAQVTIDRRDFGLTFNLLLDGRWVVSDEIQITVEGELVEQPEQEPAGT